VVAQEPEDTHSETTRNKRNPGISKLGVRPVINGAEGYVGKQALPHLSVVYFSDPPSSSEHMALNGGNISK
jgi:hypothetical protein